MGNLNDEELVSVNGGSIIKCSSNHGGNSFYYSTKTKEYYRYYHDAKKADISAGGSGEIVDDVAFVDNVY